MHLFEGANHIFSWKFYNYMRYNDTLQACPCRGAACLCQGCSMKCDDDGISVGPNIPEEYVHFINFIVNFII